MSEILIGRLKFGNGPECPYPHHYPKIPILQFSLIINYLVSYNVDNAYKVILGLIFGSGWLTTSFDRMRQTDMYRVKCLREWSWN